MTAREIVKRLALGLGKVVMALVLGSAIVIIGFLGLCLFTR